MSETETDGDVAPKKSKLPVLVGFLGALLAGGGGFFATSSGLLGGAKQPDSETAQAEMQGSGGATVERAAASSAAPTFLAIEPVTVNMPPEARHAHLRFVIQLEVDPKKVSELEEQMPRIIDIMNSYLRAVSPDDFDDRMILTQVRGHLMSRFNSAFGSGTVRDLLIMEFLLS